MTFSSDLVRICAILLLALTGLATDALAQEVVIAPQFEAAGNFHKSVAPALLDKRWGLIDRSGTWVVRPRYAGMRLGGNGLFPVQDEGGWGYINATGQLVIAARFEDAEPFQSGAAAVKTSGRWGYLRTDGTMETEFIFLEIGGREGSYVSARDVEGWAVFKLLGSGPPKRQEIGATAAGESGEYRTADRAYSISERTVIAQIRDEEQMFEIVPTSDADEKDSFMLRPILPAWNDKRKYRSIRRMSDGFAAAATAPNRWGYLHKGSGEFLWAGRFQEAAGFAGGFAPVKIGSKWGYIDRAGRVAVQPTYDAAFPFRGDYAVIRQGEKRGFLRLDPQGGISVFISPKFDDASRFTEGLAPVKIGGRWGYVSDGQPWRELVETDTVEIRPQ